MSAHTAGRAVTILRTGPLTVITDLGRPGRAHMGVPRSGALDEPALRLANRLVGNPEGHAGLEVMLGGLVLRAESACTVAVTGPPVPVWVRTHAREDAVGTHQAVPLAGGHHLVLGHPSSGMRSYLALSGGLAVDQVLGSCSTDLLSGLGPNPVTDGDRLPLGPVLADPPAGEGPVPLSVPPMRLEVPVLLGPRDDWFAEPSSALRGTEWTVSSVSNRIGLRLEGTPLERVPSRHGVELPTEPMRLGAVQVPPSGQPVIFLADGPTTGGYPVIGVVLGSALPGLAQARPGSTLRLHPV
jgi:biotin-dependent carboxylase-like uncharacterized protein